MIVDLRDVDFESWLKAIFDHPVPPRRDSDEWYHSSDVEILVDPSRQLEFLTRMCSEADELLKLFSREQIDQGLWFIFGPAGEELFGRHLWNQDISWATRQECILSLPRLWPKLFERADVGSMSYMLWDSLAYDYDKGPLNPQGDPEAERVQDAMFRALMEQLLSDVPETQGAALHGLGHLRHPSTARELQGYLRRRDLVPENKSVARAVMEGEGVL